MKSFVLIVGILMLSTSISQAKVRSIVEWDGGENPYKSGNISITGERIESKCSSACNGYSLTVTTCPQGKKLIHCEAAGCGYYNKCITLTAKEREQYRPDPLDSVDVDEIYNQIVQEQETAKEVQNALDSF